MRVSSRLHRIRAFLRESAYAKPVPFLSGTRRRVAAREPRLYHHRARQIKRFHSGGGADPTHSFVTAATCTAKFPAAWAAVGVAGMLTGLNFTALEDALAGAVSAAAGSSAELFKAPADCERGTTSAIAEGLGAVGTTGLGSSATTDALSWDELLLPIL